jgi:hypothetical protein
MRGIWNRYLVRFSFDDGPKPGAENWDAAAAYWEGRGFRCGLVDEAHLIGRRGSWIGNLFGIDMRRLTCDLDVQRDADGRWSVRLLLEGKFQYLSEWSFSELALEQIIFRRTVLGLPSTSHLEQYRSAAQRAAVIGSLTLTLGGRHLPKFWRQMIAQLAAPHEPPVVDRVGA